MGFVPATLLSAFLKGEGVSFKLELISPSILFMPPKHQSEFSSGFATNCHQNVGWLYYLKKTFHYGRMWCSTITSSHVRNLYKIQVSFTDVLLGLHYSSAWAMHSFYGLHSTYEAQVHLMKFRNLFRIRTIIFWESN